VEIVVADTGPGIGEADLPRMFQPFVRFNAPGQPTVPGTGLGLYLTRKLATEILKGELSMTSRFGAGSRFVLKIPVRCP
jgi:signal transduction histidine kinase